MHGRGMRVKRCNRGKSLVRWPGTWSVEQICRLEETWMDRGRNSRSDDGTCPWTGDEKKGRSLCLRIILRRFFLFLSWKVFQNDYQTKRMDIRLVNEFWKEFEMVDGTVKFFCGGKILLNRIRGNWINLNVWRRNNVIFLFGRIKL